MKKTVQKCLYASSGSPEDYPTNALLFIDWLTKKLETIPEQARHTATIDLISDGYDGDHFCALEINYLRPETDDEEACREQKERISAERNRAFELQHYLRLKAKYGGTVDSKPE